jgi:hypothetical protein
MNPRKHPAKIINIRFDEPHATDTLMLSGAAINKRSKRSLPIITQAVLWLTFVATALILLSSCNKHDDDVLPPVKITDTLLVIEFNDATIGQAHVDSAIVVLKRKTSAIQYHLRFQPGAQRLEADIQGLRAADYTAHVLLYAKLANGHGRREYYRAYDFTLGETDGTVNIVAPKETIKNGDWKPRAILAYPSGIEFYVSLDNLDPYFRIRVADRTKWKSVELQRYANKKIPGTGKELLASGSWKCENECFNADNLLENSTAFVAFNQKLKDKAWDHGEIELLAIDKSGVKTGDYLRYEE